ncbi:MAG: response regulator [Spirochaetia bacterium]|nr:response regulator [Spirochaetia bacterium]
MKILVVDDSTMMRSVIKSTIETYGAGRSFEIVEATNGQEALTCMEKSPVDLVLLDWQMPVLDGLSFVKQVRGAGSQVPIVMVTSVTDREKVMEAGKAGVNTYVEKPVRGSVLWENISEFLK